MRYYYLVAGLPLLAPGAEPPLTLETFLERCARLLEARDYRELELVLDGRSAEGRTSFARAWVARETQLRNAAARERRRRRGEESAGPERPHEGYAVWIDKAVTDAFAKPDPQERERALDRCRWTLAEELEKQDAFGLHAVLGYGLRLALACRWAAWDAEAGRQRVEDFVLTATEKADRVNNE